MVAIQSNLKQLNHGMKSAKPKRIPNVDTTFSLAINPVIVATDASQLTHPRGMKIQEIRLPMKARIELFL